MDRCPPSTLQFGGRCLANCPSGMFAMQRRCVPFCPAYYSTRLQRCYDHCPSGSYPLQKTNECVRCGEMGSGYYRLPSDDVHETGVEWRCAQSCPSGFYQDELAHECVRQPVCSDGQLLQETQCVDFCGLSYYLIEDQLACAHSCPMDYLLDK